MHPFSLAYRLAAAAGSVAACSAALGINGPTAQNVPNPDPFGFVGRVQTIWTPAGQHIGTGSYLGDGTVLTAAHVIDPRPDRTPMGATMGVQFERFQLDAARYDALGVQHPAYQRTFAAGESLSTFDVGLMLVLNRPANIGANPTLGGGAPSPAGASHTVIGFTDNTTTPPSSTKRRGNMVVRSNAGGLYSYRSDGTPASGDYVEPGDSGGPVLVNTAGAGQPPRWQIVGVTRSGATTTSGGTTYHSSQATRVDSNLRFIQGDGFGGSRTINTYSAAGNSNWGANGAWSRGSLGIGAAPRLNDVAVLDPSQRSDAGITVTINNGTENIDGLLNDVTLDIERGTLRVAGTVGQTNGRRTGAGALNGGRIWVGNSGAPASLDVGWAMSNVGLIGVYQDGTARFGSTIPGGYADAVLYNAGIFNVDGGRADVDLGMLNTRSVSVKNGTLNAGAFLPRFVAENTPTMSAPDAVRNWGRFDVSNGGVFNATNGNAKTTAMFQNNTGAVFSIGGSAAAPAVATVDRLTNSGTVNVTSAGTLGVTGGMVNRGSFDVRGGANGPALARGLVINEGPGARIAVGNRGRLEATLPGGPRYGTTYGGFVNRGGARVSIEGGGVLDAAGRFQNEPKSSITVRSSVADGAGVLSVHSNIANSSEALLHWGSIAFDTPAGADDARMDVRDLAWTLSPEATLTGRGTITMRGASLLNIAGDVGSNNWNDISLVYDGASRANNAAVSLEVASRDVGGGSFAGLSRPFALEELCLTNNSRVALGDSWGTEDVFPGREVLYVEKLGVADGSILDLAGKTLYYKDWGCGGAVPANRFVNGTPIRLVPTPGALAVLALGLFGVGRARRTTPVPARSALGFW